MVQGQLLAQTHLVLAQRGDPASDRGPMLADGEVDATPLMHNTG